jgi:cellulose biosynthesis protein BcsQ
MRETQLNRCRPFVVAVASEKGGVGKTTLATNLAVYLKALHEDLPVTIASFDNHFSVDNMFAIGRHGGRSVSGLFEANPAADLATMGEYGVQFLASERELSPPDDDPLRLRRALAESDFGGILVLDTRPILDYFTRSALAAADLVLVPVKDRPSLVNAASVQQALVDGGGDPSSLWLVPSLIDARLRLRDNIGIREFLVFSARERGYQVLDTFIAKSPKVEGLTTNLTSRVYPVLTHARTTIVHRQFREVASFVLDRYGAAIEALSVPHPTVADVATGEQSTLRLRRLVRECPVCGAGIRGEEGHFFFDQRSRRRGFIHGGCLERLLGPTDLKTLSGTEGGLVFETVSGDDSGPATGFALRLYDGASAEVVAEQIPGDRGGLFQLFWQGACGRSVPELYREVLLVTLDEGAPRRFLDDGEACTRFSSWRRRVLREIFPRE